MLILQDLGFRRVAIILISLIFPTFFFVLRRKWREFLARKEEINRLLVIASEEAHRAEFEFESVAIRFSSPVSKPAQRVCAVCFRTTSNRCARCKSVHYCSGKCQIIHWRQGHKNECHPSLDSSEIDDEIPITESNRIRYDYVEIATEKPDFTSFVHIPPDLSIDDDKHSIHDALIGGELELHAQFHSVSDASQSHASSSSDGTCIDDSISDIDSLHDLNADSSDFCSALDLESASSDWNEEQNLPLEEEPPSRVTSSGMFVSGDLKEKASSRITDSLNLNIIPSYKNLSNPSVATTGFWDGSLDYCRSKKSRQSTHAKTDVVEPGNLFSNLHSQGLEASSHTYPGFSNTCKHITELTSTAKDSREPTRNQSSTISISEVPVTRAKLINRDRDFMKSAKVEVKAEFLKDSALLSSSSEKAKANDLKRSSKDDAHTSLLKKVGSSSKAADGLKSGIKEPIAPAIKSVKADSNADMPSQVSQPASSTAVGRKTSVLKAVEQFRPPRLSKQSDDVGGNTEKAVFSYDLFVKLYHWNKVVLRPCGLINCGNSCYANAILQCLAFTPPLTAYLLQGYHSKACVKKEWCFTCEFERLMCKAKEGDSPLSPVGILSQIQKIGSHLSNGRQEDAHEFLRYAIDTMQTTCLQDVGVNAFGSLHEETTLLGLTFGGYLRSKIKCTRCRGKSEKQERMMDLTVEINGDIETLEEALRKFTGTEPLDGENKYHCARCKSYEKAKKKLTILEAPNILTIALKRFQSGKFGKLNKTIQFPEILNLAPYMRSGSDKSPIYRLYGVVVHLDIMNAAFSGHYVCYVRNSQNKWYKLDDSMVKSVELRSVLNKGAYMLFYSRISPRAPRSIRSSIVCHDLPSKSKIPEVDHSQRLARSNGSSRHRDHSKHVNCAPDFRQNETCFPPVCSILDIDSSSDNSSLFSHSDEVSSGTTDSNMDSIRADDISDYIFGYNAFFRHSDSDTSSSSSSSSSEYTKQSPLSSSARYSSALLDDNAHSIPIIGDPSRAKGPIGGDLGSMDGVSFLHSNNSSKQVTKLVNSRSSSSREADAEKLGWANPLDNGKSSVHLRRSWTTKAD